MRDSNKTLTATKLSPLWLRLTGRDKWILTQGFVFSSEYVPYQRNALAHYHVVYSFKVNEERYTGKFDDFSKLERFRSGDPIGIRYKPSNPDRSYYPEQWTDTFFFVGALAFGALIGIVVIAANLLSR